MARKRDGLVPSGEFFGGLDGPVQVIHDTSPQARRGFTVADQVNQLVSAREADADLGFMARLLALCRLPRTNPRRLESAEQAEAEKADRNAPWKASRRGP